MDCSFCGWGIPEGSEVILVTKKGKALYFCTSKCEKNMIKLGRKPRKVKWTREYAKEKEARLKLAAASSKTQEAKPAREEKKPATEVKKDAVKKPAKKESPKTSKKKAK